MFGTPTLLVFTVLQRWLWIRSAEVRSGRIRRFAFGPGVKKLRKNGPGSGVTLQVLQ